MSDGMTEVFRHKKIVRKKINKYVTLFLDNNDDIVIIENTSTYKPNLFKG
jgi:hypothetical protein